MQHKCLFLRSLLLHINHIWLPHDFHGLGNSDFNCLGFRTSRGSLWLLHLFLFGSHWEPASGPRDLVHQLHVLGSRLLGDKRIVADFTPESVRLIYPPKSGQFKVRLHSLIWLLSSVLPLVVHQVLCRLQHLPAKAALEPGLLMGLHVYPQLCCVGNALIADFALRKASDHIWCVTQVFSMNLLNKESLLIK